MSIYIMDLVTLIEERIGCALRIAYDQNSNIYTVEYPILLCERAVDRAWESNR